MPKPAVVLFNMGGPTSLFEVEGFLKNLFNDPNILDIKSSFLRSTLASFITNKRLEESKKMYQAIGGSSPIVSHTFALTELLNSLDKEHFYTYCMRYSPPFAKDVFADLQQKGIDCIILFSMYPQYSFTTTKSSLLDIHSALKKLQFSPKIRVIERYFSHLDYNELILKRVLQALGERNPSDYTLLFSTHAIPQATVKKGDNYPFECAQNVDTFTQIAKQKGIEFQEILLSFQSKIGPVKWTTPTTKDTIKTLKGRNVVVFPLAFTIDNSETDYELSIDYANLAKQSGLSDYIVAQCFNAKQDFAEFIINMIKSQ